MAATECPECGEKLGAEELVCPKCGWPHEDPEAIAVPSASAAPTSSMSPMLVGLGMGLIAGLVIGWIWGHSSAPAPGVADGDGVVAPQPGPSRPAPPPTLKLRERGWRAGEQGLCMGMFEVVSAPPSVTGLKFTAMDTTGAAIATDKVSAPPSGIKPGSVLELGFETGECSKIAKWKVEVLKP